MQRFIRVGNNAIVNAEKMSNIVAMDGWITVTYLGGDQTMFGYDPRVDVEGVLNKILKELNRTGGKQE